MESGNGLAAKFLNVALLLIPAIQIQNQTSGGVVSFAAQPMTISGSQQRPISIGSGQQSLVISNLQPSLPMMPAGTRIMQQPLRQITFGNASTSYNEAYQVMRIVALV